MSEAETVNLGSQDEDEYTSESGFDDSREAEGRESQPDPGRASPAENVQFDCAVCSCELGNGETSLILCSGDGELGHFACCTSCFNNPYAKKPLRGVRKAWPLVQGAAKSRGWSGKLQDLPWGQGVPAFLEEAQVPALRSRDDQGESGQGEPFAYVKVGQGGSSVLICPVCWSAGTRAPGAAAKGAPPPAASQEAFSQLLADLDIGAQSATPERSNVVSTSAAVPSPAAYDLSPERTLQTIDSMLRVAATEEGLNEKLHDLRVQLQGLNRRSILVRAAEHYLHWDHATSVFSQGGREDDWKEFEACMQMELDRIRSTIVPPSPVKTAQRPEESLRKFLLKATIMLETRTPEAVQSVNHIAALLPREVHGMLFFAGFDIESLTFKASSPVGLAEALQRAYDTLCKPNDSEPRADPGRSEVAASGTVSTAPRVGQASRLVTLSRFPDNALGAESFDVVREAAGRELASTRESTRATAQSGSRPSVTFSSSERSDDPLGLARPGVAEGLQAMGLPADFVATSNVKMNARTEFMAKAATMRQAGSGYSHGSQPAGSLTALESDDNLADDAKLLQELMTKFLPASDFERTSGDFVAEEKCLTLLPNKNSYKDEMNLVAKSISKNAVCLVEDSGGGMRLENFRKPVLATATVCLPEFTATHLSQYFDLIKRFLEAQPGHSMRPAALWKLIKRWVMNKQPAALLGTSWSRTAQEAEMETHLSLGKLHLIRHGATLHPPQSLTTIQGKFNTNVATYVENCRAPNRYDASKLVFASVGFTRLSTTASGGLTAAAAGTGVLASNDATTAASVFSSAEIQIAKALQSAWSGINSTIKCKNCKEQGHAAVGCPSARDFALPCQLCYNVSGSGHHEFDCPGVQAAQYASYLRIQKLLFGTRVNFFPLPRPQALQGSAGAHTSN